MEWRKTKKKTEISCHLENMRLRFRMFRWRFVSTCLFCLLACLLLSLGREAQNVEKQNRRRERQIFSHRPKLPAASALLLALVCLQAGDKLSRLNLKVKPLKACQFFIPDHPTQ
ncbi:hypothetical protein D917_07577 [Trichinella nativa]|uniref:Uncharacterized protein n=1 Tax=Trichinella nativa TaxID=6335 RepID=A0A1Y3ENA9_9BILA|nr:hypothetical protein D917_07577 [Trichinella nativa]